MKGDMAKLNTLTLIEAIEGLKNGDFTSVELVKDCFEQIEQYDDVIKAFVSTRKPEALDEAEEADQKIKAHGAAAFDKHSLIGIPYACKDNFSTKGTQTTASSNVLKGYIPPYDSTVTKKLKDAGAIVLGKTNMDAFAHGSSTETSDFFDTKNPWDKTKVPGGSSGGSAAAVTSNMCSFAIGSETAGSIRVPAVWCGITGFKPTYGRVSRYGVIAMASSTDSPGPLTKNIADAAAILEVIAGKDPYDATSSPKPTERYFDLLNSVDVKGLKIGKPKSYFDLDLEDGVRQGVEDAISKFEEMGAEIVEMDLLDPKYAIGVYTILQRSEVSSNLARFDGIRFGHTRDKFGEEARKRIMLGAYSLSSGYYDQYYAKAQKVRTLIVEDFKKAFESVDLIIAPVMSTTAMKLGDSASFAAFGEMIDLLQEPSAIAGLCATALPCGLEEGLPLGFQLIGNLLDETKVLSVSHKYQKETEFHKNFPKMEELK